MGSWSGGTGVKDTILTTLTFDPVNYNAFQVMEGLAESREVHLEDDDGITLKEVCSLFSCVYAFFLEKAVVHCMRNQFVMHLELFWSSSCGIYFHQKKKLSHFFFCTC